MTVLKLKLIHYKINETKNIYLGSVSVPAKKSTHSAKTKIVATVTRIWIFARKLVSIPTAKLL